MKRTPLYHLLLLGIALTSTSFLTGCWQLDSTASDTVNLTTKLVSGGSLTLTNLNGSVTITGSSAEGLTLRADRQVQVYSSLFQPAPTDAQTALTQIGVEATGADAQVTVKTTVPNEFSSRNVVTTVDYTLTVPTQALLDITNANGDLLVTAIDGAITVDISNGNVQCNSTTGVLDVLLKNGDLNLFHSDPLNATERIQADINNGDVNLAIPINSSFDIDAEIENGDIEDGGFDFDVTGFITRVADDTVGAGGAQIYVRIDNGDLTFSEAGTIQ